MDDSTSVESARMTAAEALRRIGAMEALAAFDPHWAGTLPIGVAVADSDIDLLCHAPDPVAFEAVVRGAFGALPGFSLRHRQGAVVAQFVAHGWPFELYGSPVPVAEQAGWRHLLVERRLLALGGAAFRDAVMVRRRGGMKTEPAFADALGLAGDPYAALLILEGEADGVLAGVLRGAGFR